jgi:Fic family protein
MKLRFLSSDLLPDFLAALNETSLDQLDNLRNEELPVDYFQFYKAVASVYSSKIEGEEIDFDSFFKHKFLNVHYQPDYTRKADDLFEAYQFIATHDLNSENVRKAHALLSANLLPKSEQGKIRTNPMFVIGNDDRIEYVAASPSQVQIEIEQLFKEIEVIKSKTLTPFEAFYYASLIHLVFVKVHPFQDGNGRTARLIEKWFLLEQLGDKAEGIQLEKNYYLKLTDYYSNLRKLGLEYDHLNYTKSLDFLLMTIRCLI